MRAVRSVPRAVVPIVDRVVCALPEHQVVGREVAAVHADLGSIASAVEVLRRELGKIKAARHLRKACFVS
eukprot:6613692-Prymnesium_polylepis.1